MIIDYSTTRPAMSQLHAAGVTAVGRYIGWDGEPGYQDTGKNLGAAEAHTLITAGISVFVAFEYAADAAAKGAGQGRADGQLAIRQLTGLGAPAGVVVYFTLDFDLPDYAPGLPDTAANAAAKLGPVADYFRAIRGLAGRPYRVGGYGGYYAVKRLLDAGLIDEAWQTVAWSGGQRDPRAVLYQTTAAPPVTDADVNIHETAAADFGQWPRPAQQQPDPPTTTTEAEVSEGLIVSPAGVRESRTWPAGTAKQIVMFSDWKGLQAAAPVVDLRVGHLHSTTFDAGQRTVDGTDTYTIGSPDDCNGVAFTRIDDGPATVAWHTNP